MSSSDWSEFDLATQAVRAGQVRSAEGEHNDSIFTTSSFVFRDAREAAARFAETEPGNVYSRFTNPTVRTFEERLAALEGGEYCVATASGMGAILTLCLAVLKAGDHVVASRDLFGSTISLFTKILSKFGIDTTFVSLPDIDGWRRALQPRTKLMFLESPSNPLSEVADLAGMQELARGHGALLAVDNVMCTPVLQRPFEYGADIVVHSATKYLDGQGRCVGGAVVVRDEELYSQLFTVLRTAGPSMSPFNAWVFLKGLETLSLRMYAHSGNAMGLAEWLQTHPAVNHVYYPGLSDHPHHALAARQQSAFGGIVSFTVRGGRSEAWSVIDATRMLSITANLGDTKTTITHPASTTHGRLTDEQRRAADIGDDLIRISVGLEALEDIRTDLARGLDAVAGAPLATARNYAGGG